MIHNLDLIYLTFNRIRKDLAVIIKNTGVTKGQDGYTEPLILILDIITASIRELRVCTVI